LPRVVAVVRPDQFEPGKAVADLIEDKPCAIAVLDAGGMNDGPQRQAFGVDKGVNLSPVATVNPIQLAYSRESGDARAYGRHSQTDLVGGHRVVPIKIVARGGDFDPAPLRRKSPKRLTLSNFDRLIFAGLFRLLVPLHKDYDSFVGCVLVLAGSG
jgi:hypothetical protein